VSYSLSKLDCICLSLPTAAVGGLVQQIFRMPYSRPVDIALLQEGRAVQAEHIPRDGVVSGLSFCES